MQNILKLITFCLLFTGCVTRTNTNNKIEKGWTEFSGLNIKMKGVVYSVDNKIRPFHGRGIIRINILETNTKRYDPRDKQLNYYCIIKNNKAELYDTSVNETSVGDTIEIDTKEETIKWLNYSKLKQIYSLSIGEVEFFDYIKENKLQEF